MHYNFDFEPGIIHLHPLSGQTIALFPVGPHKQYMNISLVTPCRTTL